jgi:flagellar motor protein MotB
MSDKPTIIIKKRGKKKPHEAHGGSWKIAYADFVTAMMAFFLLMWLLSVTNEDQKKGIANYFSPNFINSQTQNGSAGLMGGVNLANPNNSSGTSTQERTKNTEVTVDVVNGKRQEELQDPKELTEHSLNGAKKEKTAPLNNEKVKENNSIKVAEKATITAPKEHIVVDPLKDKQGQATKETHMNHAVKVDTNNADPTKTEQIKANNAQINPTKIDSTKTDPIKPDANKTNETIEKIVKVDLHAIKTAKKQATEKETEQKALNQAAATAKNNNAATTYERSIANAMSNKKIEQQKAIEKEAAESKEKQESIKKLQLAENEKLKEVANAIKDLVQKNPELQGLLPHLVIENRPEGLRIQLIDKDKKSMFASGSSSMTSLTKQLLKTVASLIEKMPNGLVISGHTDAHPFVGTRKYSNWELSSDRANATRRALEEFNVAAKRFESVMGKEATDPFVKEDPFAESNRRISITLLREYGMPSDDTFKQMTGG